MVDYNELRKRFPTKDETKRKKLAAKKAIAREFERKRALLSGGAPVMKKGIVFYAVVVLGLMILGSLVLSVCGKGGKPRISRAAIQSRQSVDALATALGRYRFHVGEYPSNEEGLEAIATTDNRHPGWNGPYVKKIVPDPWGNAYVYVKNGENETPTLYSKGPDGVAGTTDDVLPNRELFDEPFRDTTWTNHWVPYQFRGIVVAPDELTRKAIQEEVLKLWGVGMGSVEGVRLINDGWRFAQAWKECSPTNGVPVEHIDPGIDSDKLVWKAVTLPHDWAIESGFAPSGEGMTGRLPWRGVGYYRRELKLPRAAEGKFIALRFEGVMAHPEVFLNGQKIGGWDYGYMGFEIDVSDKLKFGEPNELSVRVDTSSTSSRWYPGAGIYRDVKLIVEDMEDRMIHGSLRITCSDVCRTNAKVRVEYLTPITDAPIISEFNVPDPMLWEINNPHLYSIEICGREYKYGIRSAEFTADDGFHLNGRRVQLKGVNLHSDLGPLGMAFNRDAMRRQLEIMKDMGVNAIRTSHNACDPQLLELCDEMGFVVWNECYDKWDETAGIPPSEDFQESVARNLREFVRRDRNHPCVICWSLGNEIWIAGENYPWHPNGNRNPNGTTRERCAFFRQVVLEEDDTRPVGMGCCCTNAIERGDYADLDITGWNYRELYAPMKAKYPDKPVVYTESASAFSSWGYYAQPISTNAIGYDIYNDLVIDGYDRQCARWADIPDVELARMERDRYCAGEFVWTGIDYLGEPSPNARLNRSSFFGICDLMGMPKDRYYLYRSVWNDHSETVHLLPHWNWDGLEGEKITVVCYTSGDEAELYVNGETLGRKQKIKQPIEIKDKSEPGYYEVTGKYRLSWEVPYEPGELHVVAYRNGHPIGEAFRKTAFNAFSVKLTPEKDCLADGELTFVKVELVDDEGTVLPLATNVVSFAVEGPGEIVAVGNGSTDGIANFKEISSHPLYYGRAAVVVRRTGGSGLPVVLKATTPGVRGDKTVIGRK